MLLRWLLIGVVVALATISHEYAPACPDITATCSRLTCGEAQMCLAAGNTRLDRDSDNLACEAQCP